MYAGSLAAKHEAQARQDAAAAGSSAAAAAAAAAGVPTALEKQQQQQEAPLMGKQPAPDEHLSRAEQASRLPSFLAAGAPTSQNEQWARMTNDPLLAIKQQEQEALKRVKHNPIKMQQILKEVGQAEDRVLFTRRGQGGRGAVLAGSGGGGRVLFTRRGAGAAVLTLLAGPGGRQCPARRRGEAGGAGAGGQC